MTRPTSYDDPTAENRLVVGVEWYAGYRGEQTPRVLILGDGRIGRRRGARRVAGADYRYFKLRAAKGDSYLVRDAVASERPDLAA
jgi:hypothetical protein